MKKNGFTLVELLAVIAILAILVIIALPNIMSMFNSSKKNAFVTEAKRIYRGAEEQFIKDSMFTSGYKSYSKCKNGCNNELDMDVRDDLEYYIQISSQGKVVKYYIKDNSYQFSYDGEMNINDIDSADDISSVNESDLIVISHGEAAGGSTKYVFIVLPNKDYIVDLGGSIPAGVNKYSSYQDVVDATEYNYFLRIREVKNKVTGMDIGFVHSGNVYYLKGIDNSYYSANKSTLSNTFNNCLEDTEYYNCNNNGYWFTVGRNGYISVGDSSFACNIDEESRSASCFIPKVYR